MPRRREPPIYDWKCDKCGLELPRGDGAYLYVQDDRGKRVRCTKGQEVETVREVLGPETPYASVKERMGRNQHCICLDCRWQFDADYGHMGFTLRKGLSGFQIFWQEFAKGITPDRDPRCCPRCRSERVRTSREIVGMECPKCGEGKITATEVKPKSPPKC